MGCYLAVCFSSFFIQNCISWSALNWIDLKKHLRQKASLVAMQGAEALGTDFANAIAEKSRAVTADFIGLSIGVLGATVTPFVLLSITAYVAYKYAKRTADDVKLESKKVVEKAISVCSLVTSMAMLVGICVSVPGIMNLTRQFASSMSLYKIAKSSLSNINGKDEVDDLEPPESVSLSAGTNLSNNNRKKVVVIEAAPPQPETLKEFLRGGCVSRAMFNWVVCSRDFDVVNDRVLTLNDQFFVAQNQLNIAPAHRDAYICFLERVLKVFGRVIYHPDNEACPKGSALEAEFRYLDDLMTKPFNNVHRKKVYAEVSYLLVEDFNDAIFNAFPDPHYIAHHKKSKLDMLLPESPLTPEQEMDVLTAANSMITPGESEDVVVWYVRCFAMLRHFYNRIRQIPQEYPKTSVFALCIAAGSLFGVLYYYSTCSEETLKEKRKRAHDIREESAKKLRRPTRVASAVISKGEKKYLINLVFVYPQTCMAYVQRKRLPGLFQVLTRGSGKFEVVSFDKIDEHKVQYLAHLKPHAHLEAKFNKKVGRKKRTDQRSSQPVPTNPADFDDVIAAHIRKYEDDFDLVEQDRALDEELAYDDYYQDHYDDYDPDDERYSKEEWLKRGLDEYDAEAHKNFKYGDDWTDLDPRWDYVQEESNKGFDSLEKSEDLKKESLAAKPANLQGTVPVHAPVEAPPPKPPVVATIGSFVGNPTVRLEAPQPQAPTSSQSKIAPPVKEEVKQQQVVEKTKKKRQRTRKPKESKQPAEKLVESPVAPVAAASPISTLKKNFESMKKYVTDKIRLEAKFPDSKPVSLKKIVSAVRPLFVQDGTYSCTGFAVGNYLVTVAHGKPSGTDLYVKINGQLKKLVVALTEKDLGTDLIAFNKPTGVSSLKCCTGNVYTSKATCVAFWQEGKDEPDMRFAHTDIIPNWEGNDAYGTHFASTIEGCSGAPLLRDDGVFGIHRGGDEARGNQFIKFTPAIVSILTTGTLSGKQ